MFSLIIIHNIPHHALTSDSNTGIIQNQIDQTVRPGKLLDMKFDVIKIKHSDPTHLSHRRRWARLQFYLVLILKNF